MNNIIWKRMIYHGKDLGDYYLVSNTGEIKGVKTGKIRKKNINHEGYYFVCVSLGSRDIKPCIKVHRAVAETFLENMENLPDINHKDGNKLNNHINNLEFCTHQYNILHAYKNELIKENGKKIICLNNLQVFDKIIDAANWCGCKDSTISDYLASRKNLRKSAGKHPQTGENLTWLYYHDYLYLNN
jgi:hypothetical protein